MSDNPDLEYAIYFQPEDCTCNHTPEEHCDNFPHATAGCEVEDCECKAMWIDDF